MSKSLKEFTRTQRNKFQRLQLEKQRELKRGKFTKHKADQMTKDVGHPMFYMNDKMGNRRTKI